LTKLRLQRLVREEGGGRKEEGEEGREEGRRKGKDERR
jgi:hypothetical protein